MSPDEPTAAPAGHGEPKSAPRRRRGRRLGKVAGAVIALGTVGAATAAAVGFGGRGEGTGAAADPPAATAAVTRKTLLDTQTIDGDLGYGSSTALANRLSGTITAVPVAGSVLDRGKVLYRVDTLPVVLMYGAVPAYRALGVGDEGGDVKQLEENLAALGYTGFTVDDEYTSSTATAVRKWQDSHGLSETGRVDLGRIVFAAQPIRVDEVGAALGQSTGPGQEVLKYTGTTRVVTVTLDVGDQRLAKTGTKVRVTLPEGRSVEGTVGLVHTVIEEGSGQNDEAETKIEAEVALADPAAATGLDAAKVKVVFTASERKDVLTVPVSALVVLAEGGYGVEVVEGGTSHYVAVKTGLFSGGWVEVSGDGLAEGMTVGMPK